MLLFYRMYASPDEPINSAKDLHVTAVRMHRNAYDKLGILYKAKNGYYKQVMKFIAFKSYKMIRNSVPSTTNASKVAVAAVGVATVVFVGGYLRNRNGAIILK